MNNNETVKAMGRELKTQAMILGGMVALMWVLEIVDWLLPGNMLDAWGIRPRTLAGLWGILFSPFLHVGFAHLAANTIPFLILGWLVMMRRVGDFWVVTAVTILISGLGVWSIGPSRSVHLGASGLIFGYFGFLLLRGYFERSCASIAWAVIVFFLYGGLIWGILPQGNGVSWQGHLFGLIGGGLAAYWLAQRGTAVTEGVEIGD